MNTLETIAALKRAGFVVRVKHERTTDELLDEALYLRAKKIDPLAQPLTFEGYEIRANGWDFAPRGGRTVVRVYKKEDLDNPVAEGIAVCAPIDTFVKELGLAKAVGRVVAYLRDVGITL